MGFSSAEQIDPDCFILVEDAKSMNRTLRPTSGMIFTGWRAIAKRN